MRWETLLVVCVLVIVFSVLFGKVFPHRHHKSYHHKYSYLPPISHGHKSGWIQVRHASRWVKARLYNAPEYEPEQGIHYFPYCRGRHFEYIFDDEAKIYKRRLHKH